MNASYTFSYTRPLFVVNIITSTCLCPAHNLKVAGSNPAPAPNLSLVTARLRGILVFVAGVAIHRETAIAPPFEVSAGAPVGFPKSRPPVTRRCGRRHEGGDLGRDRDQVIPVRLRDDGQQERGGGSSPRALLRIIELPHPIARRPPRGLGHIGQSHDFWSVGRGARDGYSRARSRRRPRPSLPVVIRFVLL